MSPTDSVETPVVTILVPVYNGARTVTRTIRSVLQQGYLNYELVVIDDHSSDGSLGLVQNLLKGLHNARVIEHNQNVGISKTLNQGLRESIGTHVLILHQDCSLVGSDWLQRAIDELSSRRCAELVARPLHKVHEMRSIERLFWLIRNHPTDTTVGQARVKCQRLFSENKCDLFRRDVLIRLGGFDEYFRAGGEDQALALALEDSGEVVVYSSDLKVEINLGAAESLGANLRKEVVYGRQVRSVLLRTRLRSVRLDAQGSVDSRLSNRAFGTVWPVALVAGILLALPLADWWLALVGVAAVLGRAGLFWARALRFHSIYELTLPSILFIAPVGLVSDLAYLTGMLSPGEFRVNDNPAGHRN